MLMNMLIHNHAQYKILFALFMLSLDLTDIDMDLEHCNPNRRVGELPPSDRFVRITRNFD